MWRALLLFLLSPQAAGLVLSGRSRLPTRCPPPTTTPTTPTSNSCRRRRRGTSSRSSEQPGPPRRRRHRRRPPPEGRGELHGLDRCERELTGAFLEVRDGGDGQCGGQGAGVKGTPLNSPAVQSAFVQISISGSPHCISVRARLSRTGDNTPLRFSRILKWRESKFRRPLRHYPAVLMCRWVAFLPFDSPHRSP